CFWGLTVGGPSLGIASIPIAVSPYFQDRKEDKYWEHERYERVASLGPMTSGTPPGAVDRPSDDEVRRALEQPPTVEGGVACAGKGPSGRRRDAVPLGAQPQQCANSKVQDCRLCRSAARVSARRPSPAAPCALQMHHLLRRCPAHRLAGATYATR